MGQDVDIEATTNFDGQAITPPLLRVLNIEGQDILLQDKANNTGQTHSGFFNTVSTGNKFIDIPVYLPNNIINEFYLFNINNVSANYVAKAGGDDNLAFPMDLIEPCVLAGSRVNDVVFDPFMGSGTTAAVALMHNRQYLGSELNPQYYELQQERLEKVLKERAA
jgi:adenine specific DNA methylase Mod